MEFPKIPRRDKEILPWAADMTTYVRASTPRSGSGVKVNRTPNGTTFSSHRDYNDPYNFEVVEDHTYTASADERRLSIRGGYFDRVSFTTHPLTISTAAASYEFGAVDSDYSNLGVASSTIADGEVWIVYLGLWSSVSGGEVGIAPTSLFAGAEKGTTGSPPARPTDPKTTNRLNWNRVMCTVTNTGGRLSFKQEWRGGNIKDFMLIPDGKPEDATNLPRIESLDYITAATNNKGQLQDRQAYESLVVSSAVTKYYDDYAIPYFEFRPTGVTQKKYARVDSNSAASWATPHQQSLQINGAGPESGTILEVFDMHTQNNQESTDAHALFVNVDVSGNSYIEYQWPVQIDDGLGMRPRNQYDGSSFTTTCITGITAGVTPSVATIGFTERDFTVQNGRLEISDGAAGTSVDVDITNVDSSVITWDVDLPHDQTDPNASASPHGDWPSETNGNHDDRYWFHADGTGGADSKNYDTTGTVKADHFELTDSIVNYWNDTAFQVDVSGTADVTGSAITITADTSDVHIIAAATATVEAGDVSIQAQSTTVAIDATTACTINAATYFVTTSPGGEQHTNSTFFAVETGTYIYHNPGTYFLVDSGSYINLAAGTDIDLSATNQVEIVSNTADIILDAATDVQIATGTYITLDAGSYLDLNPIGELRANGVAGRTLADWFLKGLMIGSGVVERTRNNVGPNDRMLIIPG